MAQRRRQPLRAGTDPLRRPPGWTGRSPRATAVYATVQRLRRPVAFALVGLGLPACGWLARAGLDRVCLFGCYTEAEQQLSDEGEGYIFVALMAAFALTLLVQWIATDAVSWSRGFVAWAFLVVTSFVAGTSGIDLRHANATGLSYVPFAIFLAAIVPPRNARWTGAALVGAIAIYALIAPHQVWIAIAAAPVPLVGAEAALSARRSVSARTATDPTVTG